MNKRQAKKQFKKRYGMNPGRMGKTLETELSKTMEVICKQLPIIVNEVLQTVIDTIKNLRETLQKMDDGEFEEFIQRFSESEKMLVISLREGMAERVEEESGTKEAN